MTLIQLLNKGGYLAFLKKLVSDGLFVGGAVNVARPEDIIGIWYSQTYTSGFKASGSIQSKSIPAGIIGLKIQFKDEGASILNTLGYTVGSYTESEADTEITALLAGTAGAAERISIGDSEKRSVPEAANATLIAWKSTGIDSGNNAVIISWKVAS